MFSPRGKNALLPGAAKALFVYLPSSCVGITMELIRRRKPERRSGAEERRLEAVGCSDWLGRFFVVLSFCRSVLETIMPLLSFLSLPVYRFCLSFSVPLTSQIS